MPLEGPHHDLGLGVVAARRRAVVAQPGEAGLQGEHAGPLVADPERRVLTGAVAVGPESGEWLQQLTLAIRAETPIDVLLDVIQPYPTFSEGVFLALRELNLDV